MGYIMNKFEQVQESRSQINTFEQAHGGDLLLANGLRQTRLKTLSSPNYVCVS